MKKSNIFGIIAGLVLISSMNFASAAWSITNMLNSWADQGIFSYVLPFLLVFALVFGLLEKSQILGQNKAVIIIIALVVGLLSLVGDVVPKFFQGIFPYTGVALSILLVGIILIGLFFTENDWGMKKTVMWTLFTVGVIAFVIVVYSSMDKYNFTTGNFWSEYGPAIVTLVIIVAIVVLIALLGKKSGNTPGK